MPDAVISATIRSPKAGASIVRGRALLPSRIVSRLSPPGNAAAGRLSRSFAVAVPAPWRAPAVDPLGRLGALEVRLAASAAEVRRAQALRFRVFYREMAAVADRRTAQLGRDCDRFDGICDHLLVLDHARRSRTLLRPRPEVVGTYRLLRQEVAERHGGFYTAGEYDIEGLLERRPDLRFLELGRSCVLATYRTRRTVELLWHGVWAYVLRHGIDVMIGCASLEGTDPERLALPLSFLHHAAGAPEEWQVRARAERRVEMNRLPRSEIDPRAALRALPPLIKGYLRLGAWVGDGAVVDTQFGTIDVCIVLPVAALNARYVDYYGPEATRYAVSRSARRGLVDA
jgi:putative hemolysin